jgi:hypothetical protein
MRTVKYTGRFKRDYRREKSGRHGKKLDGLLTDVVNIVVAVRFVPVYDAQLAFEAVSCAYGGTPISVRSAHTMTNLMRSPITDESIGGTPPHVIPRLAVITKRGDRG